ncbi:hypothetical protein K6W16_12625 [Burkholderia dolosa]|uniref:Uncharacterized protein n=1 Tax=Burkholderia dolosa TaxID=152500 RepID=A0A892IFP6_9BURK|nr:MULTISPECIES: hypothetical protein [Burkholderia]MBR8315422.1 hypothetical protein [Burkholderia dolosa]MBR8419308.1 hypothetical protein [Burkholderia dolosa]MBY4657333.1 hypothetical protein [Burkholderia dolosa]MBY4688094.1 hypothetical protein [Burkholderia dolosa]MBY4781256.1 hypothetical protein [Burkholderia dolosa]
MSVRFGATDRERTILFDARLPSRSPHDADTAPYAERLAARLALQPVEERIVANENIRSNAFTAASAFAHICDRCSPSLALHRSRVPVRRVRRGHRHDAQPLPACSRASASQLTNG